MASKIFGLIGYPLGHSFSRKFFNDKFEKENIDAEYQNFEIPNLSNVEEILKRTDIAGLNVTIPYKLQIMEHLDNIDSNAAAIGSVNVIKIERNGSSLTTKGFNTDIIGFHDSIAPHLKDIHQNALILGTGGASKAVAQCFYNLGISHTFVSRNPGNDRITYGDITDDIINRHKIIVNTTPLGMYPKVDTCPDIPYESITPDHICFDLTYNPSETLFLKKSKDRGALTINGLEMLIGQALAAWKIWNE